MSVKDAEKFIDRIVDDKDFRLSLLEFDTIETRDSYLKSKGFSFSCQEFEIAMSNLKFSRSTLQQLELLDEIEIWFKILNKNSSDAGVCNVSACTAKNCPSRSFCS